MYREIIRYHVQCGLWEGSPSPFLNYISVGTRQYSTLGCKKVLWGLHTLVKKFEGVKSQGGGGGRVEKFRGGENI